jgi:hypothetical protein
LSQIHELVIVCETDNPKQVRKLQEMLEAARIKVNHLSQDGKTISGHATFAPQHTRTLQAILEAIVDVVCFKVEETNGCSKCRHQ